MFFLCNSLFRASIHRSRKSNAYAPAPPQTAYFNADIAYKDAANIAFLYFLAIPPPIFDILKGGSYPGTAARGCTESKKREKTAGREKVLYFCNGSTSGNTEEYAQKPASAYAAACPSLRDTPIIYKETQHYI